MDKRLGDIATLRTGIFAKPLGEGELVYLQVRHFDEGGRLERELFGELPVEGIAPQHFLQPGDVLFAAKGIKNFAAVYEKHNPPAVASTSFFVLRLNSMQVLPEYLTWFLNRPDIQTQLKAQAIGTSIPSISKQVLENLEIAIPSIAKQKAVIHILELRNYEKEIVGKIEELRGKIIQQKLTKLIR